LWRFFSSMRPAPPALFSLSLHDALPILLALLGCLFNIAATLLSAKVSTRFAADLRREVFHRVQDLSAAEVEKFGTASLVTRSTSDRKSTRLNSSHVSISYAVFCLKTKNI